MTDLLQNVRNGLAEHRIESPADLRKLGRPLVAFSPAVDAGRLELKEFLMDNLYRHYRVVGMAEV